ncbi:MAG: RcpC/CpaB family pilus assembly protein [Candidatus Dormibacteraeota bacterium]|nr:RcpC/CpaB family pilus assembly protein [Candidatus Dormibacteraeota bacterium]
MTRTLCLVMFVVLSGIAGFFYYDNNRQVTVLVATQDLKVGSRVQEGDLTQRQVNPSSVGDQVMRASDQVVGQFVAYPILKGQFVDARQITSSRNANLVGSGLPVPAGFRIVGIPITPSTAVGGALKPGDRVDVIAIPNQLKNTALVDTAAAPAETLGRDVLVVGMRTDQGTPFYHDDPAVNATGSKPSSVLLAIGPTDEARYSTAIVSSTFLLALSTD